MAQEDKVQELRHTWRDRPYLLIVPLLLVLFYFIFFTTTASDSIPAEQNVVDNRAIIQTKEEFAEDIGYDTVELGKIKLVSQESREWSDGCLGLPQADEMCTQALVEGYELTLEFEADSTTYTGIYRTDQLGDTIRKERITTN